MYAATYATPAATYVTPIKASIYDETSDVDVDAPALLARLEWTLDFSGGACRERSADIAY
ncbi:hypothetical protein CFPU101_11550 [Chroococcus sp. FPU101]|nr:hypothetical protein CFPU101_11550 [Chroococcus sp. FPU101]